MHRRPHACSQFNTLSHNSTHTHSHTQPHHSLSHTYLLTVHIKMTMHWSGCEQTYTYITDRKTKHTQPLTLTHTPARLGGASASHLKSLNLSRVHSHQTPPHTHRGLHWSRIPTSHPTVISDTTASGFLFHTTTPLRKAFAVGMFIFSSQKISPVSFLVYVT